MEVTEIDPTDPEVQRAASIRFACPYCGAIPGHPCADPDGSGVALLLPHYSRIPDSAE